MEIDTQDQPIEDLGIEQPEVTEPVVEGPDWEPPRYHFAGGSVGAESMYFCDRCSALLQESGQGQHSKYHERTDAGGHDL